MAIFSRRIIQRLINENSHFVGRRLIKNHVAQLNSLNQEHFLATEWEVVLINCLSKIGKIEYEKDLGVKKRADVFFEHPSDTRINFLADITTVSDKALKQHNPADALHSQFHNLVQKRGIISSYFTISIGDYFDGKNFRLKLPGRSRFSEIIFNNEFYAFLDNIELNPRKQYIYSINKDLTDLTIVYDPLKNSAGMSHVCFDMILSKTNNTIYNALYSKRLQLSELNYSGLKGIFLCNGSCELLRNSSLRKTSGTYTIDDIVKHFLIECQDIDFVVTVTVDSVNPRRRLAYLPEKYKVSLRSYFGQFFQERNCFFISEIINKMAEAMPEPERDAFNALHYIKGRNPEKGRSLMGELRMKIGDEQSEIKLSARSIQELLAGRVSQQIFAELHRFDDLNPFERCLQKGQTIFQISKESSSHKDDDLLVFDLRGQTLPYHHLQCHNRLQQKK